MKNPRGYFLSGLFLIAALLFAMGSMQGNPVKGAPLYQSEITNPPPVQIVNNVIIETPIFQVVNEPVVSTQIVRGVSVPYLGLSARMTHNYYQNQSMGLCRVNSGTVEEVSDVNSNYSLLANRGANQTDLRGVNTRLDIGERASDIS
jgi:hypothetical protein